MPTGALEVKLTDTKYVTLPLAGKVSFKTNVVFELVNTPVERLVPFFVNVTPPTPSLKLPVPLPDRVKPVILTGVFPGLLSTICNTVTLVAPASWVEFDGGFVP